MRVQANRDLTFFYGMVPYTVTAGQIVDSAGARHLLDTGADVTVLDEEPPAAVEAVQATAGGELDITGKISDVLAWVGDNQDRALEAHAAEEAKDKPRTRLLAQLEEIATGEQAPAGDGEGDNVEAETIED